MTDVTARPRPSVSYGRILRAEVSDEVLGIVREPTALFFTVIMPVAFFLLFAGLFGAQMNESTADLPVATTMLATFGAYAVIGASMMMPGIGLAEARERGWMRVLKTTPVPIPLTLAGRVVASLPYAIGILVAMTVASAVMGNLEITVIQWLLLVGALVLGSLPFALIGLAVGSLASGNATTAILNALVIPLAIASGLWFPLDTFPDWVATLALGLPTYHLAQLASAPLDPTIGWPVHVAALLGFTAVAGVVATMAYRRSRT